MKRIYKPVILVIVIAAAAYNSVYFRPLNEVLEERESTQFDASVYTVRFWNDLEAKAGDAIPIQQLIQLLASNPDEAFENYSNVLGIGNIRFFLARSSGTVKEINDDHVIVETDSGHSVRLATDYIFGNAVRDASGLIDVSEFSNTMHFNEVSSHINQRVVEEVLSPFLNNVNLGDQVSFTGALELHRVFFDLDDIEIIPVRLQISSVDR